MMRSIFQLQRSKVGEYWTSSARTPELLSILNRKKADDNPGTDDFERSFSSLAHQYIKSRAPQLIDYAIGFQTIKRVDDPARSKAVGVFGFKVDDLWLFVPVFFLQGDLKGHELLWVKNRDNFLPCKENWVTFLINRQPTELGEPAEASFQGLGGKKPSLRRLFSPSYFGGYKMAEWCDPILPLFAAAELAPEKSGRKVADYAAPFDLAQEAMRDVRFLLRLHEAAAAYPLIKRGLDTWYGPDMLAKTAAAHKKRANDFLIPATEYDEAVQAAAWPQLARYASVLNWPLRSSFKVKKADLGSLFSATPKKAADPREKVQVLRTIESTFDAEEAIKKKFAADGFVVVDGRADTEINKIAADEDLHNELKTPDKPGLYETAMQDGTFKDMIIFHSCKQSPGATAPGCLVINPSNKEEYARFPGNEVLAKPDRFVSTILDENAADMKLKKWLRDNKTSDISKYGIYIAVDEQLNCTMPFLVEEKTSDERFQVSWLGWETARLGVDDSKSFGGISPASVGEGRCDVTTDQPGRRIMTGRGWCSLPANAFIIKLEQRTEDNRWKSNGKTPAIANTETLFAQIQRKYAKCSVFHDGEKFEIKYNRKSASFTRDREAIIDLILRVGIREKEARDIVSTARNEHERHFNVKLALDSNYSPDIPDPWTGTEPVGPNKSIDAIYRQQEYVPVVDAVHPDPYQHYSEDEWFQPDSQMMQMAQQASASGQKDLFDIGVLVALANTTDTETMIDRYLGRYMSAIDGLGRTLFHIYNNYEALSDRFGSSDMPQLEDGVRNTFTSVGDTTLYLKEKSVGGNNGFDMGGSAAPDISKATTT